MKNYRLKIFDIFEIIMVALWVELAVILPSVSLLTALWPVAIWLIVSFTARFLGQYTRGMAWTLLVSMAAVGVLMLVNLNFFTGTHGASPQNPYLINPDAALSWRTACDFANGVWPDAIEQRQAYGILMSLPLRFTGLNGLLAINSLMVMLTIVFTGRIAREATGPDNPPSERISTVAMIMVACVCNFMATGSVLLKDAMSCAMFSGCVMCLLVMRRLCRHSRVPAAWIAAFVVMLALSSWIRPRSVMMVLLLMAALVPYGSLRCSPRATAVTFGTALLAIAGAFIITENVFSVIELTQTAVRLKSYMVFGGSPRGSALTPFIAGYPAMPLLHKIALLPFTMGLQMFLPLPWTYMRHAMYGPSMIPAHFGFFWYLEAGMVLYFVLFCLRKAPAPLLRLTLAGAALYAGIAFLHAGTVSRYILPLLPVILPAAAWALCHDGTERRFRLWMCCFATAVLMALAAGYCLYSRQPAPADEFCLASPQESAWNESA